MSTTQPTLESLAADGIDALLARLGPLRTIQFIRLCGHTVADYTAERSQWLSNLSLDEVLARTAEADALGAR